MNSDQIDSLIKLGIGDIERLKHIKQSLEQNKPIYNSDKDYVEKLVLQHISNLTKNNESEKEHGSNNSVNSGSETSSNVVYCGKCGHGISETTNFCPKCGAEINQNSRSTNYGQPNSYSQPNQRLQRPPEWKNEGTTLILSILLGFLGICGIGHIYVGKLERGIVILIVGIILLVIGIIGLVVVVGAILLVLYIPLFIWQILDSRKVCREYNDYYEQHGRPPW